MTASRTFSLTEIFTALVIGGLVLMFVSMTVATMPGAVNVPVPVGINSHAMTTHPDAEWIWASYETGQYECLRVYRSGVQNRLLYRLTYANMVLQGGIITTTSGKPVTAYMRTRSGWDSVIVRDGFALVLSNGQCPN